MRVLIIGAGRVGTKVIFQLKKNPRINILTVDPRERPIALEQGLIESVDFHEDLNPIALKGVLAQVKPDLVLVTTSAGYTFADFAKVGVPMAGLVMAVTLLLVPLLFPY